ncbi:MAG: GGDEF domain-containing protein [Treponema sp.]|jgi:diguanylate cyclase (GGDEF)-like protein|nr:GGDEF domain-containing protein [Treponema sp.]
MFLKKAQFKEGTTMTSSALYPLLSTGLVLVLIFADYTGKVDTDHFQRKIYLSVLVSLFTAITVSFVASILDGKPGAGVHIILQVLHNLFFIVQNLSYYLAVVLIDYLTNRNNARAGKFIYLVLALVGLHAVIMVVNIFFGFYFYITEDNRFMNGPMFLLRFYLGYIAILIIIVDMFLSAKNLRTAQVYLLALFAVLIGAGAALDLVFSGSRLLWAFFTGGLLYGYFYIIRRGTTQDAITGLGNRSSFAEFVNQVIRMPVKQSYSMALFDINGLKKINDTQGVETGDRALSEMAEILKQCSRQSDFLARIGGDEFLIAIKAKFDIEKLLARILRTLETCNKKPDRLYTLSISYGYATFTTKTDQTIDEFLQRLNGLVFQHKKDQRHEEAALAR